ncbi:SDR family NAD(P)-dependent oxidoreductase [Pseudomonas sp. HS6]|uniref:SDR family NAD(P)-dependent oxidoreductase n=1 Tax=Pseudomonas sp. HS6 TaxID=2850559 RepID=UPI0020193B2B|nr:SDR family NAD(P)-dependent oxidoreductase [Pseudomonas sp. HS6]UQS14769.1 SDR family NAD(P)-dependent oxidoreductase [Pseudomonas sp. HS6]
MDIFKRHFVPTPIVSGSVAALRGGVLLTDSDEFARWGSTAGLAVIQTDIERLAAADELEKLLSRLDAGRAHTVLCALSGECPPAVEQYSAVSQCTQVFLALLKGLIKQSRAITLIGLRRHDALAASVLDGLGLSACQETTRLQYASLIVEGALTSTLAEAIATVLQQPGVRYRFDAHTLAREHLEPVGNPLAASAESALRTNACYVVTGGGGGVGRLLCRWLSREYRAKVCVVGRSPVDDERRAMLLAHGVTSYVQADVADRQSLAGALQHFKDRYGAIDGVFHLAGTTADRLLINKNPADVERVLLPKIAGSLNLWALDSLIQPGFVCHFSSLSGLVGNVGQADYAAANGFIDELTDFVSRQAPGGHARWQSINWGLWASEGMQMAEGSSELLPLSDEQGLAALRGILDQSAPRLVAFAGSRAVLGTLNPSSDGQTVADAVAAAQLPAQAQVSEWLGSLVHTFSGLRDVSQDASLVALGVTSSALISIVSAVEQRLNATGIAVSLSKALIFDYSSIGALTDYLLATQPGALAAAFASERVQTLTPIPAVEAIASVPGAQANLEARLTQWVQEVVQRFSGLSAPAVGDNLLERGLDSVASINIATELARRLSSQTPVNISKTLLFEYSSIGQIVRFLTERFAVQVAAVLETAVEQTAAEIKPADVTAKVTADAGGDAASDTSVHYRPDDIAIIGVAGEFPGADNLAQLWALLESGAEAISVIPAERWDWQLDYCADPKQPGTSYGRHGGFLRRAKQFDPGFFSITPIEAARLDPQERRLLEMAYHALEDAGHFAFPLESTGVFTAAMFGHYQNLNAASAVTSSSFASIANRISYTFNLQGPSLCVDTMCSGSLTALHLAINSLRSGECAQALVGAVNIMPHPGKFKLLSAGRFLSPSGRCHSFGIEADGYVPGEGAVALLLKPLAHAQANDDRIHGVIRASALNSGGRSSGFTVPSARAQEQVIRQALSKSGVEASQIDYVEAHGTGTRLGDPIEINALSAAYGTRQGERRCIGSIKSNIGHLESAAGLAGLVKILLQFQHQVRVPTLNCEIENPWLNLAETDFRLPRTREPWSAEAPLLAGLSSFGAGGSNAHVIVQQYIATPNAPEPHAEYLLPVSARTPLALKARINDLSTWLKEHPQASLAAIAYTLGVAREHFGHRHCFVADNLASFTRQLVDAAADKTVAAQSQSVLQPLQASYLAGGTLNFAALHDCRRLVSLPHYPFEEQSYWDDQLFISGPTVTAVQTSGREHTAALEKISEPVCFQTVWEPQAIPPSTGAQGQGVIVFCSPSQSRALVGQPHIVVVTLGDSLRLDEHFAQVRSDSIDDCRQVLQRYASGNRVQRPWLINLVHSSAEDMQAAWARWQFTLAKAISAEGAGYRMAFVHEERQDAWPLPAAGAVNRLFRVLQMEQPEFQLLSMTVAAHDFERVPELLVSVRGELANAVDGFSATRHVAGERWQSRVREVPWPVAAGSRFRHQGVYLITGGLGLIGLAVATRLIQQFDARVVLVGRSPTGNVERDKLAGLAAPASVEYISADISDSAAVNDLIRSIIARHGALHGVLHAAGITRDGLLRNKQLEDFQKVIAVKLNGTRNLDHATADVALDFFVLFSSVSGLFGNVGQADYAVANHYLDLFAGGRQRQVAQGHRRGLSLSVNWPLWLEEHSDDASDRAALGRYLQDNYGMQPLTPAVGVDLLVRLIDGVDASMTQIAPFMGDSEKIRRSIAPDRLHSHSAPQAGAATNAETNRESATPEALKLRLKALLSALTGLLTANIDDHCSFGDLGLNSVMLQQLAQDIEAQFNVPMAPNTLFTYNSVAQLIEYLHERGAQATAGSSSVPGVPSASATLTMPGDATEAHDQRIAIIGMDGRLPGGDDIAGFWQGLIANRSAIQAVRRWPEKDCHAGIIADIEHFDARFFGISAREAMLMDPQHRLFLQACYNTLLDAGYAPSSLKRVGVFAGVQFTDYQTLLQRSGQSFHPFAATGNAHAMLANRVSYLFDFEGPSQSIDTACSSALVAVNRAVMSLQRGECDYALAGAVSLLIDSDMTEAAQSMGVLSPNFRCATFDSEADGYVRAEGVGSLLLKRLADARRDGDSIHAVIEAAEENHGGRGHSLTAPNPNAQKRLLLAAYTPELAARVSYIETHGTGTRLGDPVEIDALKGAWRTLAPDQKDTVLLGSVKTNVGHLEPAAAIASLFKVILAFKHRMLPANLHLRTLNPYIDFEHSPFKVLDRNTPWEGQERVAGISSFGFGGTNAHVVLSEPPACTTTPQASSHEEHLVVLSARSCDSLLAMKGALLRHLESPSVQSQALADIAFTLGAGREHFEYRLAWNVRTVDALVQALRAELPPDIRQVGRGSEGADLDQQGADLRERYLQGGQVAWRTLYPQAGRLHLPGYAFDTRQYWFDDEAQVQPGNR